MWLWVYHNKIPIYLIFYLSEICPSFQAAVSCRPGYSRKCHTYQKARQVRKKECQSIGRNEWQKVPSGISVLLLEQVGVDLGDNLQALGIQDTSV